MRRARFILLAMLGLVTALSTRAQLPQVPLPRVPVPGVPGVPETSRTLTGTLRELAGARALRVERLIRENRAELDRDPRGELVVRAEVVAIDITPSALDKAITAGFRVLRTEVLQDLGIDITVLETPEGMSATRGLKRLRKLDPEGTYDFNHVYLGSGLVGQADATPVQRDEADDSNSQVDTPLARVGLVDTGVDGGHVAMRGSRLHHFGCDGRQVPDPHGTAVASILVGGRNIGDLYAADVYCGEPTGGAVDAVARALGWMARERVAVVNVSLVGPRNSLLERAVKSLVVRGHIVVAAVGNDGPSAPPLYPAAYEGVVGVTGVDGKHRVLIEALRGKQVDFAARGADMRAASQAPDQYVMVRGTSFAAPQVAALFAGMLAPDAAARSREIDKLTALARDLGKPGRDDVYGAGLVAAGPDEPIK
jgi:subtilisin family serine protease